MSHYLTGPLETQSAGRWATTIGGSTSYGATFYYPSAYQYSECWGTKTLDYWSRLKAGDLLPLTSWIKTEMYGKCTGTYDKTRNSDGYRSRIDGFAGYRAWYPSYPALFPDVFLKANTFDLTQKAAANAYTKGFDAGTFLAEAGKTIRMFSNAGRSLYSFTKKYLTKELMAEKHLLKLESRLDARRVADLMKQPQALLDLAQDAWLGARYGIRPLIYDLEGLQDAVISFDKQRSRYSSSSKDVMNPPAVQTVSVSNEGEFKLRRTQTHTCSMSMRGLVVADIKPAQYRFNLVTTAWELVPYSFVVDWFFDVGQALEALSFLTVADRHYAANGYKIECSSTDSYAAEDWIAGWSGDVRQDSQFKATYIARKPTFVSSLPQTKLNINTLKVIDSVALLRQLLRRS